MSSSCQITGRIWAPWSKSCGFLSQVSVELIVNACRPKQPYAGCFSKSVWCHDTMGGGSYHDSWSLWLPGSYLLGRTDPEKKRSGGPYFVCHSACNQDHETGCSRSCCPEKACAQKQGTTENWRGRLPASVHCARSASPIQLAPSGMKMGFKPWLRHSKTCEKPTKAQGPVPKQFQGRPNTRVGWCWGRGWTGEGDQILV